MDDAKSLNSTPKKNVNNIPNDDYELIRVDVEGDQEACTSSINSIFYKESQKGFPKWSKSFKIIDCAIECINSPEMKEELKEVNEPLLLKLQIEEKFENLNSNKLQEFCKSCRTKSIIVLFVSRNLDSFSIFWKSTKIDYFLALKPPAKTTAFEIKELYGFVVDCLIHFLSKGHLGIRTECQYNKDSNEIELTYLADEEGFNILKLCAEEGESNCTEILLNLNLFKDDPADILNAQSRAQHMKHFGVLLQLLRANYTYPTYMTEDEFPEDLRLFIKICEDIHEAVKSKNVDLVTTIVEENPTTRHFYNKSNKSVLKVVLEKKLFNIYEILLVHDVTFGPHEDFSIIFGGLSDSEKTILREIHFRCSKDLPENHMNVLMMNTSIGHDDREKEGKEKLVHRAYSVLNKDPLLNPILKIVAASKHFDIIFDFKRTSVEVVDPTAAPNTRGLFYIDRKICIGAQQLLDPATEHETFGTLAHELCHYAMNLTFKNSAKPYFKSDRLTKAEYKEIVKFCKEHREKEEIISFVYDYEEHLHSAELIVRAAHLLALYHNQPEKLQQLREIYSTLFNYHSDVVIPAINKVLPGIKAKADKEVKEKDRKISNLTKLLFVSIGLGIVIACLASFYFYEPTYNFDELSEQDQNMVRSASVKYKNVEVKLSELFPENSGIFKNLTSDHISELLEGKELNFDDPQLHYLEEQINLKWRNLAEKLREKFLDANLNFQGETVKFRNLNESCSKAFSALTSQQIINVLNETELVVGKKTESEAEFYIKRKFIPEDIQLIAFEYEYGHEYVDKGCSYNAGVETRTKGKSLQEFTEAFLKQGFNENSKILDKVKENLAYKSTYYNFNQPGFYFLHKSSTQIIEQAVKEKILILSSEAGTGKTVTFEHLAMEMKTKFPTWWVSYIDFKDHTKLYKTKGTAANTENLLKKILELSSEKNEFEVRIFEECFKSGTAVLVWNGFDEISPTYNEFVLNLIKFVHENTTNVQFLSTRPLYSEQLSKAFRFRPWHLVPFNEEKKQEFLRKFFISQNVSNYKIMENIAIVEKIIQQLNSINNVHRNLNNPLMLKLIADIHGNEKMFKLEHIYGIYEIFVQKKIEIWLRKSDSSFSTAKKLIFSGSVKNIFQKFAFLSEFHLFSYTTLGLKMRKLQIMQKEIPKDLPIEEISRMGILYINGKNNFKFAHKTFAEFFVAQYFIENIFEIDGDVNNDEAELRLELFFHLTKTYGDVQQLVTDFMSSFLEMRSQKLKKNFHPTISRLLRTKFKKFFIRLLDTNYPQIFIFLIEFFKKDHDLLIDLLHVNEDETFYTAILNPNNFALYINTEYIRNLAQNFMNEEEFQKFIKGKNQKGKVLLGLHFYGLLGFVEPADPYDTEIKALKGTSYWEFFHKIKGNLTENEQKQLFVTALSPKVYLYYHIFFRTSDFPEYEKLWTNFESLLSPNEMQDAIGNALILYFEINPYDKLGNDKFLSLLIQKAGKFLSSFQIFEMFLTKNILHETFRDVASFQALWKFLTAHSSKNERREILLQNDADDKNFNFYSSSTGKLNYLSSYVYWYFNYDFTPFKIIHRSLFSQSSFNKFLITKEIYAEHFNQTEMQEIFLSSNDFFYYAISYMNEASFQQFMIYLVKLFEEHESLLIDFAKRKIKPTNLSFLQLVDDFKDVPHTHPSYFNNVNICYNILVRSQNKNLHSQKSSH